MIDWDARYNQPLPPPAPDGFVSEQAYIFVGNLAKVQMVHHLLSAILVMDDDPVLKDAEVKEVLRVVSMWQMELFAYLTGSDLDGHDRT